MVLAVRNYQFLVSITKRVHNVSKGNSWFCQFVNNGSESILEIAELLQKKNKGLFLFLILHSEVYLSYTFDGYKLHLLYSFCNGRRSGRAASVELSSKFYIEQYSYCNVVVGVTL